MFVDVLVRVDIVAIVARVMIGVVGDVVGGEDDDDDDYELDDIDDVCYCRRCGVIAACVVAVACRCCCWCGCC